MEGLTSGLIAKRVSSHTFQNYSKYQKIRCLHLKFYWHDTVEGFKEYIDIIKGCCQKRKEVEEEKEKEEESHHFTLDESKPLLE